MSSDHSDKEWNELFEKQELGLPRVDQMPKRPPEKSVWDDITVELDCTESKIGYAGCGSHQLHLTITLERGELTRLIEKYKEEAEL